MTESERALSAEWRRRFLDTGASQSLTATRRWIYIRLVVMTLAAGYTAWSQATNWETLCIVLIGTALVQTGVSAFAPSAATLVVGVLDMALLISMALLSSDTMPSMLYWFGTLVAWHGLMSPTRISAAVTMLGAAAMSGVVWHQQGDYWWATIITIVVLALVYVVYGAAIRRALFNTELDLLNTVTSIGGVVQRFDIQSERYVQVYGDVTSLTGHSHAQWLAAPAGVLIHPEDLDEFRSSLRGLAVGDLVDRTCRFVTTEGETVWLRETSSVVAGRGGALHLRGCLSDVTQLETARELLAVQTRTDTLTGLPNRKGHNEHVGTLLAAGTPVGLIIADLDNFKEVNDVLGHTAGDVVLCEVADRLVAAAPLGTHVARLGGDEFALAVSGAEEAGDVTEALAALSDATTDPVLADGIPVSVGVSAGVGFSCDSLDRSTLMRHADIAMYAAKREGKFCEVFRPSFEHSSTERLELASELPGGLARGELVLLLQPKIELATGSMVGVEGLARWIHPEHGLLTPDKFLDVALLSDHFDEFERAMLEAGIAHAVALRDAGVTVPVAVNVSVRTVRRPGFGAFVIERIVDSGLPPHHITIEVTEEGVDDASISMAENLRVLLLAGVGVSIDDFGTGYSSLRRLTSLDVSEIKIDRSFVSSILTNSTDRVVVGAVVDLGRQLNLEIVAEGVETQQHADTLASMGCGVAQGYLYSPAVDRDALIDMYHANVFVDRRTER